jgi:hypothetical protein
MKQCPNFEHWSRHRYPNPGRDHPSNEFVYVEKPTHQRNTRGRLTL